MEQELFKKIKESERLIEWYKENIKKEKDNVNLYNVLLMKIKVNERLNMG